jgi:hypothetical protein
VLRYEDVCRSDITITICALGDEAEVGLLNIIVDNATRMKMLQSREKAFEPGLCLWFSDLYWYYGRVVCPVEGSEIPVLTVGASEKVRGLLHSRTHMVINA